MTEIIEIQSYSTEYHEAMQRFLDQLTTNPMTLTEEMFRQLLASPNSHLFFLMKDEQIAGMLTVGIYHSPTGGKAWIEAGMSLKKQPAERVKTKHQTPPEHWKVLCGEYKENLKLCFLPTDDEVTQGYWFGFETETQKITPVFKAKSLTL